MIHKREAKWMGSLILLLFCYDTAMINIKLFHFKFKNARIKQIEHSARECIIPIR